MWRSWNKAAFSTRCNVSPYARRSQAETPGPGAGQHGGESGAPDGKLLDDFAFSEYGRVVHVGQRAVAGRDPRR